MGQLISASSMGYDPDRGYENCNCWYDYGNGQTGQVFMPCPCTATHGQASGGGTSNSSLESSFVGSKMGATARPNNLNKNNMYNPNNVTAGNSMAMQQADLGRGQLVNTARGLRYMRYPSVARMKPVSLYARPSSPVTPKVSRTRELARRKRNPMLNMNVSRKRVM